MKLIIIIHGSLHLANEKDILRGKRTVKKKSFQLCSANIKKGEALSLDLFA